MNSTADCAQERQELEAVLASGIFNRAPNLAHLLTYVCAKFFEGTADQIKEYNIAVDALGRPAVFDQKRDSIVRVEAHRLRKRLREYYGAEGADHALRIDIPPGQYAPKFVPREAPEPSLSQETLVSQTEVSPSELAHTELTQTALTQTALTQTAPVQAELTQTALVHAEPGLPAPIAPAIPECLTLLPPAEPGANTLADDTSTAQSVPGALIRSGRGTRNAVFSAVFLLVFCTGAVAVWNGPIRRVTKVAASPTANLPVPVAGAEEVRILAGHLGADYTDRLGRVWRADRYFQGGHVFETKEHPILGTREPRIYQSRREGTFSYDIPLSPGVYELRLHFAETLYGENNVAGGGEASRVFNVSINGAEVLHEFDVICEAGPSTADVRVFKDISPSSDGKLHLKFDPFTNPPLLSAIEITPGTPGRLQPIRMIALDRAYTDKQGRTWEPDRYARGGQLVLRTKPVEAGDPELFRGERYGNLKYVIPVPPGRYGVTIYFAEAWFGPGTPPGGGAGSRVFDILANGVVLRHSFDIFKDAKGAGRATTFTTHGLEPDAQGKLTLALIPIRNYAFANAIEVLDESK